MLIFEMIQPVRNISDLTTVEEYYIKSLMPFYNTELKPTKPGQYKTLKSTRTKISRGLKGKKKPKRTATHARKIAKNNSKPVLQFTRAGSFVKKWESASKASRELQIQVSHIKDSITGKRYKNTPPRKTAGGYVWKAIPKQLQIQF